MSTLARRSRASFCLFPAARGVPCSLPACRRLSPETPRDDPYECIVNTRVELLSHVHPQVLDCGQWLERLTIRTLGGERVERISGAKDPGAERNFLSSEAERIAGAVPMLMMVLDVLERLLDVKQRREDV